MQATSKGSDQTARMRRLIWGFAGLTNHIIGNLMPWLLLFAKELDSVFLVSKGRFNSKSYYRKNGVSVQDLNFSGVDNWRTEWSSLTLYINWTKVKTLHYDILYFVRKYWTKSIY